MPRYLQHIENLNYPKENLAFHFLVNDSTDESKQILEDWKEEKDILEQYRYITISEVNLNYPSDPGETSQHRTATHQNKREDWSYHSLSFFRNMLLDLATLDKNTDFLFSVDSDILLTESILNKLLGSEKDIVAGMVVNGYRHYNFIHNPPFRHDRMYLPPNDVFKVRVTGACILISRKVFSNKNIRYFFTGSGEDEGFCATARNEGFNSFVLKEMQEHVMGQRKQLIRGEMVWHG